VTEDRPLILVADDDAEVAGLVAISLRRAGFNVVTAANGEQAIEQALEHRPAACVLDIMMPNMNGYEVVRRLKEERETARMPIVLLSARAGALDRDFGLRIGADAYIRKPFPPKELGETVWALLQSSAERRV
jgi:two-component system alkaline phosphatase synthesis response regulator PhoP